MYENKAGSLFRITNNAVLNLTDMPRLSSGGGKSTIVAEKGSLVNIVDSGVLESNGAPTITATDSRLNVHNSDSIFATDSIGLKLTNSNAVISRLKTLSGSIPIQMSGTCHVNINRINSFETTGADDTCIIGTDTQYGSLLVQNTNLVDGKIQTHNMNVTLVNVNGVSTSGADAALVFSTDSAKGTYRLKIEGPTVLDGTKSLSVTQGTAKLRGVTTTGLVDVTDSVIEYENSYITKKLTATDSTITGTRTSFEEIAPTTSHITLYNSTLTKLTSDASSTITYHSTVSSTVDGTNRSAMWLHNSKVAGNITLASGSSLIGSAANLPGSATVNAAFMGVYGGTYGAVTTSNQGLALAFGSSSGTIDNALLATGGTAHANIISGIASDVSLQFFTAQLHTVKDTRFKIEQDWFVDITRNTTLHTFNNYSHVVGGSYQDSVGTAMTLNAGSFNVTATGAVIITGSTVTI